MRINEISDQGKSRLDQLQQLASKRKLSSGQEKELKNLKGVVSRDKAADTRNKNKEKVQHGEDSAEINSEYPDMADHDAEVKQQRQDDQDKEEHGEDWASSNSEFAGQEDEPVEPEADADAKAFAADRKAEVAQLKKDLNTPDDIVKNFVQMQVKDGNREQDPELQKGDQGTSSDVVFAHLNDLGYPEEVVRQMIDAAPEKEQSDASSGQADDAEPEQQEPEGKGLEPELKDQENKPLTSAQENDLKKIRAVMQKLPKSDLKWLRKELDKG